MRTAIVLSLCCLSVAACGGSGRPSRTGSAPASMTARAMTATHTTTAARSTSVADRHAQIPRRVCAAAVRGARGAGGRAVSVQLTGRNWMSVGCRLRVSGAVVKLAARADAQAWGEWDTVQVHQVQAYGVGSVHQPRQIPQVILGHGDNLLGWIPAERELFATNGSQTTGGSYVVATFSAGAPERVEKRLGVAIALAVMRIAPRGPA